MIVHIFEKNYDYELRVRWEQLIGDRHQLQITKFIEFLRSHVRAVEIHSTKPQKSSQIITSKFCHTPFHKVLATVTTQPAVVSCQLCNKSHSIRNCQEFMPQSPIERFQSAKKHRLCINCLGSGHLLAICSFKFKCQTCYRSHHTLLHFGSSSLSTLQATIPVFTDKSFDKPQPTMVALLVGGYPKVVLLSTVILDVGASNGFHQLCRALLYTGLQASFITDKAAYALMLRRYHSSVNTTTFASTISVPVRG